MDTYCASHNQFCLNKNVVKKELLWWLRWTRKYVREGRVELRAEWSAATQTFSHALVNGDNTEQRVAGQLQCKPLTTLEKIALERYRSTVFNFKRCHEKSHKLLLLTICTICSWWNVCVPTPRHFYITIWNIKREKRFVINSSFADCSWLCEAACAGSVRGDLIAPITNLCGWPLPPLMKPIQTPLLFLISRSYISELFWSCIYLLTLCTGSVCMCVGGCTRGLYKIYIMHEEKFLPGLSSESLKRKQNYTNTFYTCVSTTFLSDAKVSSIIAGDRSR